MASEEYLDRKNCGYDGSLGEPFKGFSNAIDILEEWVRQGCEVETPLQKSLSSLHELREEVQELKDEICSLPKLQEESSNNNLVVREIPYEESQIYIPNEPEDKGSDAELYIPQGIEDREEKDFAQLRRELEEEGVIRKHNWSEEEYHETEELPEEPEPVYMTESELENLAMISEGYRGSAIIDNKGHKALARVRDSKKESDIEKSIYEALRDDESNGYLAKILYQDRDVVDKADVTFYDISSENKDNYSPQQAVRSLAFLDFKFTEKVVNGEIDSIPEFEFPEFEELWESYKKRFKNPVATKTLERKLRQRYTDVVESISEKGIKEVMHEMPRKGSFYGNLLADFGGLRIGNPVLSVARVAMDANASYEEMADFGREYYLMLTQIWEEEKAGWDQSNSREYVAQLEENIDAVAESLRKATFVQSLRELAYLHSIPDMNANEKAAVESFERYLGVDVSEALKPVHGPGKRSKKKRKKNKRR